MISIISTHASEQIANCITLKEKRKSECVYKYIYIMCVCMCMHLTIMYLYVYVNYLSDKMYFFCTAFLYTPRTDKCGKARAFPCLDILRYLSNRKSNSLERHAKRLVDSPRRSHRKFKLTAPST